MALDVLVGIFLVALVALGYRKGALSQVTWMASVGLAFVGFDRFGGALLGFGKATVVAYGAAWLIGGISPSLEQADPQDALRLRDSELVRLAQGVRPFFAQAAEPAPVSSLE
jgi:hypothetical protein